MSDSQKTYNFTAFISYRRGGEDEAIAKWLQKKLEHYRIPTDISSGSPERKRAEAKKRFKIFRDKTDLGTHADLDLGLTKSLDQCRFLILVASPRSAESSYVDDEVRYFQNTGRGANIIPFIISGTPVPKNENEQMCYPPSLGPEVLGVTLAEGTKEESLIKVVARLLQVDFSHLYQRHLRAQRRFMFRALTAVLGVLLLVSGLAVWALNAERRATAQRNEAEELVRFLTLDLSVDVYRHVPAKARKAISDKVDAYYTKWGTRNPKSMFLYAINLYSMGLSIAQSGDIPQAQDLLLKSLNAMRALRQNSKLAPLMDAAEAECLGLLEAFALAQNDPAKAEDYVKESVEAKRRHLAKNPNSAESKHTLAAGLETLRILAVGKGDLPAASEYLGEATGLMRDLAAAYPQNTDYRVTLAGYLTAGCDMRGDVPACEESVSISRDITEGDPFHRLASEGYLHASLVAAKVYMSGGSTELLAAHAQKTFASARLLREKDPKNDSYKALQAIAGFYEGVALAMRGDGESGKRLIRSSAAAMSDMKEKSPGNVFFQEIASQFDASQKELEAKGLLERQ